LRQKICEIKDLEELSCKEFVVQNNELDVDAFLVYFNKRCYAYENSCPHTGVNLNWQKEQFFSFDGLYLQCSMHGALFEPVSGLCVRGPCRGSSLKKTNLEVEANVVYSLE